MSIYRFQLQQFLGQVLVYLPVTLLTSLLPADCQ